MPNEPTEFTGVLVCDRPEDLVERQDDKGEATELDRIQATWCDSSQA